MEAAVPPARLEASSRCHGSSCCWTGDGPCETSPWHLGCPCWTLAPERMVTPTCIGYPPGRHVAVDG